MNARVFIPNVCLGAHLISASVLPGLSDESGNRVATFFIRLRLRLGYDMNAYPYNNCLSKKLKLNFEKLSSKF